MPYRWVSSSVFLEHNDVVIYHVFKDDYEDQGARTFWYGWNEDCTDDGQDSFDVRDLVKLLPEGATDAQKVVAGDLKEIRRAIIAAIDAGVVTEDGIQD